MTIRLLNTNNVPATGINPPGNPMNAKSYGIAPVNVTPGAIHIDTTLSKVVTFDGSSWRDPVTGAVV